MRTEGNVQVSHLIDLMKTGNSRGVLYIRPSFEITRLIFRNGLMALKCCIEIVEKMAKARATKWNDCDFGPN